jgi:sulfoxide reductase heme-binding subunit YedZ
MINKFYKFDSIISDYFLKYRKRLSFIFLYVIPVMLVSVFLYKLNFGGSVGFSKEMGELGYNLILLMLFISPILKIFSKIKILRFISGFRKELGMLSFWALSVHFVGQSLDLNIFNKIDNLFLYDYLIYGFLAYIGIFILGVTSNKFSMKFFGKKWFLIHKVLYLVLILSVIHVVLIKGDLSGYFVLVLFFILKLFVYLKFDKK